MHRPEPSRLRLLPAAPGIALLGLAIFLPTAWYDALPRNPDVPPPPFAGVTLLRWTLAVDGLIVLALALFGRRPVRLAPSARALGPPPSAPAEWPAEWIGARAAGLALAAITALALLLRCLELGSDLWVDEVQAVLDARGMTLLEVYGSYLRSNVHVLNTLLMKASFALFGEAEWSARLPAVLFGTATVPLLYRVTRGVATREVRLAAALLLAVSYHHVFFSQNARGYVSYVFFALLSSALLVDALRTDRGTTWALYVVSMVVGFASLLITTFVFLAHVVLGLGLLVRARRRGAPAGPLARRLTGIFATAGLLGFLIYCVQLPQVIPYVQTTYAELSGGYRPFSLEFAVELRRGILEGFRGGRAVVALGFLGLALVGFLVLVRRNAALAVCLVLALALTGLVPGLLGLTVSPRYFLLAVPLAVVAVVLAVDRVVRSVGGRMNWSARLQRVALVGTVLLFAVASASSLRRYYAVPKQSFRAALAFAAAEREPGGVVVALHIIQPAAAYYAPEVGLREGTDFFLANTLDELRGVLDANTGRDPVLLSGLSRILHVDQPGLELFLASDWKLERTFPATIGDGEIDVWRRRDP